MIEFFPVVPNVWCLRRPSYLTCSYVVSTNEGYVFIDASMDSQGADVKYALTQLGADPKEVRGVILTHWHNDHSGGAKFIETHCTDQIFCHSYEGGKLTSSPNNTIAENLSAHIPEMGPLVLLRGLLKDGPAIQLKTFQPVTDGEIIFSQFEIITTPGHTPGHIAVLDRKNSVLFAGDALAVVNGELRRMSKIVTEDLKDGYEAMLKVLTFEADVICPGHREPLMNAKEKMKSYRKALEGSSRWPFFG